MIKKILILAFVLFYALQAYAVTDGWQDSFRETYQDGSIDEAVVDALAEGVKPDDIVGLGVTLKDLLAHNLIKALYCAGAKDQDIHDAAERHGIEASDVLDGFKRSIIDCGIAIADIVCSAGAVDDDIQPYTPINNPNVTPPSFPSATPGGRIFASPSTF